ncbi:MAG: hypothetical protein E6767_14245 [Dysgonomonas sp.]|nr:hypothetical protein [Dysgonomonas sp.]
MRYILLLGLFIILSGWLCKEKTTNKEIVEYGKYADNNIPTFTDSLQIGDKGKNKLVIKHILEEDSCYVDIFFYERTDNGWLQLQKFNFDASSIINISSTIVQDYNNDGFGDFTYHSAIAARGANEVRKLFVYSPESKKLIYIQNSEEYPNLEYNKELNCIDAFAVYGGTTTSFMRIKGDSLLQFARIDLWDNQRIVKEIDKNGKETILKQDSINDGPYIRYINYKTLEEYTEN